jgi:hypothetical protein
MFSSWLLSILALAYLGCLFGIVAQLPPKILRSPHTLIPSIPHA